MLQHQLFYSSPSFNWTLPLPLYLNNKFIPPNNNNTLHPDRHHFNLLVLMDAHKFEESVNVDLSIICLLHFYCSVKQWNINLHSRVMFIFSIPMINLFLTRFFFFRTQIFSNNKVIVSTQWNPNLFFSFVSSVILVFTGVVHLIC